MGGSGSRPAGSSVVGRGFMRSLVAAPMGAHEHVSGHKSLHSLRRHCVCEDSTSWLKPSPVGAKPLALYSPYRVRYRFRYLNLNPSSIPAKSSPSSHDDDARTACTTTASLPLDSRWSRSRSLPCRLRWTALRY